MFLRRLLFKRYLDKKEVLFYTIHRHWVTIQGQMIKIAIFGYVVPILALIFIVGLWSPVAIIFYGWMFIALLYSIYAFMDWYLDAWLITNISIIDTSWDGPFKQRSSRVDFESIESVDIEMKGVKQSLLNFGKITLIRSSNVHVNMDYVRNPQLASSWITRVQSEVVSKKGAQDAEAIKGLLADIIQDHIRVNS